MDAIRTQLTTLWEEACVIWSQGGWAMYAIAAIAVVMFGVGTSIHLKLRRTGFRSVPEGRWRTWIDRPEKRRGPVGRLIELVMGAGSVRELSALFEQVRRAETIPFERDLRVMKVCVSAAPLVGLLGTVTGMLSTFGALSLGSGGDKTMGMVAQGISEALITTETGLVIALPGLFFQYQLTRAFERYKAFLTHLETVCSQAVFRGRGDGRSGAARRAAAARIARAVLQRLDERGSDASPSRDSDDSTAPATSPELHALAT